MTDLEKQINDRIEEYQAGLAAVATSTGRAKLDAWEATINKRDEIARLVRQLEQSAR